MPEGPAMQHTVLACRADKVLLGQLHGCSLAGFSWNRSGAMPSRQTHRQTQTCHALTHRQTETCIADRHSHALPRCRFRAGSLALPGSRLGAGWPWQNRLADTHRLQTQTQP